MLTLPIITHRAPTGAPASAHICLVDQCSSTIVQTWGWCRPDEWVVRRMHRFQPRYGGDQQHRPPQTSASNARYRVQACGDLIFAPILGVGRNATCKLLILAHPRELGTCASWPRILFYLLTITIMCGFCRNVISFPYWIQLQNAEFWVIQISIGERGEELTATTTATYSHSHSKPEASKPAQYHCITPSPNTI
jgi:hypothetical protein